MNEGGPRPQLFELWGAWSNANAAITALRFIPRAAEAPWTARGDGADGARRWRPSARGGIIVMATSSNGKLGSGKCLLLLGLHPIHKCIAAHTSFLFHLESALRKRAH